MKAPFHSRDLASQNKKPGGEFLGEEQTTSDILNWEFFRMHQHRETTCGGAEPRPKQVRGVLQDTGHLRCPLATLWSSEGLETVVHAHPKVFLSSLQIAESAFPGHIQAYLFIYSFSREGRRSKANHFNEKLSYLIMQNKVLHDTALFQVNLFKNELPNKDCWKGKNRDWLQTGLPCSGLEGLSGVSAFFPLRNPLFPCLLSDSAQQHPGQQDPRCSLWSRPPRVTSANTHGAFKRVEKGILERDDTFHPRPYPAWGGRVQTSGI